jgi:Flp pilus assembly protein TadG
VAVEFALILPILLLLVLGIIEFGFGYHAWDATQNAAREGARLGAVSFDENEIIQRTKNAASVLDDSKLIVQVTCAPEGSTVFGSCQWNEGDTVRVQVDYVYDYITPLPGFVGMGPQMSMTSIAEARFEGQ